MYKRFLRTISILLVICLLIMPSINNVYATESFTSVFGGGDNGKQALAFMTVMTGLGITFVSQSDAVAVYNEIKETSPGVINLMLEITKSTWIGMYDTVITDLLSVKEIVYNYLVNKFDTLSIGTNSTTTVMHFDGYNFTTSIDNGIPYIFVNGLEFQMLSEPVENLVINKLYDPVYVDFSGTTNQYILLKINISFLYQGLPRTADYKKYFNTLLATKESPILGTTINISSDAGVLEGEFQPNEDEPVILPPPFVPGLNLKEKTLPNGSISHEYDGTIDDYLKQAADNNTYSDVETYLQTGSNTTTLTQTDTGLAVGEVSDVPYPDTNIDTPTDVLTGIGTIGGLIQGLTNWLSNIVNAIKDIFAVPTDLTLNFDSLRLVDFKNKFPFSIPWDLYRAISAFAKSPTTPNMAIDLETEYFQVYQPIDLNSISFPLAFARYSAVVFFIMFLIGKTRDLIKW